VLTFALILPHTRITRLSATNAIVKMAHATRSVRTPTDLEALRRGLFNPNDLTPELGPLKGFYMTRASDEGVRDASQHGGTVTALIALALQEGLINTAIVAEEDEKFLPRGVIVRDPSEVRKKAKSQFVVSPTLACFNDIVNGASERIGVVATPCQVLAFAKMRTNPFVTRKNHVEKLRLVLGLFCGWAFSWRELKRLLQAKLGNYEAIGMDIPPSRYHSMEVQTRNGTIEIPLDEVMPIIRECCNYCFDMTAEFSDLSVGSGRHPDGWRVARGWNQVIVRSQIGQELLELARSRGVLEFYEMPEGNLERLKKASMNKKRFALDNLIEKSGDPGDCLYLDSQDPVFSKLLD